MAKYHKVLGFPAEVKLPKEFKNLVATRHAQLAALDDKNGGFRIPVSVRNADVFELVTDDNGKPIQYGISVSYNASYDLTLIVVKPNVVKTAWLCDKSDKHATLDTSKYARI